MSPYRYMETPSLPRELTRKIIWHRKQMFRERVEELRQAAGFALRARYDHKLYKMYKNGVYNDFNRESFLLYCMSRRIDNTDPWEPGMDAKVHIPGPSVDGGWIDKSYTGYLANMMLRYELDDDLIAEYNDLCTRINELGGNN